jgi:hypothetical protein
MSDIEYTDLIGPPCSFCDIIQKTDGNEKLCKKKIIFILKVQKRGKSLGRHHRQTPQADTTSIDVMWAKRAP